MGVRIRIQYLHETLIGSVDFLTPNCNILMDRRKINPHERANRQAICISYSLSKH